MVALRRSNVELSEFIQNALAIQSIPAPTFHEQARGAYLTQTFSNLHLSDVQIDSTGNVLAKISGGDRTPIVICAHLDTVFPVETPLDVSQTKQYIRGPGIGDNALGLAALIELAKFFHETPPQRDIWLVGTVGEEGLGNLRGMKAIVDSFQDRVAAYIVIEGMALGHIYNRGLPVVRYKIEAFCQGGHSWIHAGRQSAIHALINLSSELLTIPHPRVPKTTLNIGIIQGGSSINSIASDAFIEIDVRSEDQSQADLIEMEIRRICSNFRTEDLDIRFDEIGRRPGGELDPDHHLIQAALHAYAEIAEVDCVLETGSTDASYPLSLGLPAVCVGITRGGDAHTLNEYIEIKPIQSGFSALTHLITSLP